MTPGLVLCVAMLQFFRNLGLAAIFPSLLLAHLIVTLPYVGRTMIAARVRFDFAPLHAARTQGRNFPAALWFHSA